MSWRSGSKMFLEMWPIIERWFPDREMRIEFTAQLLRILVKEDMDPYDVEDAHPDVRAAMRQAGIAIAEPERYRGDPAAPSSSWISKLFGHR